MERRRFLAFALTSVIGRLTRAEESIESFRSLLRFRSEPGAFRNASAHVQGICCDDEALYVVFENYVYKLDWTGSVLRSTAAPSHSGDACLANGRLYVSMSTSDGSALYEYDRDLQLLRKLKLERCPGCDGVEYFDGRFYIGGPSTVEPHLKNLVLVYDAEFNLVDEGEVDFGTPTVYGPQAITSAQGRLLFAFYPTEDAASNALRAAWTDKALSTLGASSFDAANGWAVAPKRFQRSTLSTRLIVARTETLDGETALTLRAVDFDGRNLVELDDSSE